MHRSAEAHLLLSAEAHLLLSAEAHLLLSAESHFQLLLTLAPYAVGLVAAAPAATLVAIFVLGRRIHPVRRGCLFLAGAAVLDVIFVAVAMAAFAIADRTGDQRIRANVDLIVGITFLLGGVAAATSARRRVSTPASTSMVRRLITSRPIEMLVLGFLAQLLHPDGLVVLFGGVKEVLFARPPVTWAVLANLLLLVLALVPYHLPVLMYAVLPARAGRRMFRSLSGWLYRHLRRLESAICLGLGLAFAIKGTFALYS